VNEESAVVTALIDFRKLHQDSDSPFVFTTERGGPLTVGQLEYIVREAGLKARLPVPAHPQLRHSQVRFDQCRNRCSVGAGVPWSQDGGDDHALHCREPEAAGSGAGAVGAQAYCNAAHESDMGRRIFERRIARR
jgi:hypothetical protein